jgi:hypothetical protein
MAHVPSTLPRGSGERESAIFQAVGAIVGSSGPAPASGKRSPLKSSPGSGSATKSPDARPVRPYLAADARRADRCPPGRWEESLADEPTDSGDGVGEVDIGPLPDDITVHLDAGYDSQKTRDELAGRGMTRDISHKATSPDPGRAALAC